MTPFILFSLLTYLQVFDQVKEAKAEGKLDSIL